MNKIVAWTSNELLNHEQKFQIENINVCFILKTHFTNHLFIKLNRYKIYQAVSLIMSLKKVVQENLQHYKK